MKNPNTPKVRHRGITLMEIAIVLGIIGLIVGAIWVAASSVYSNMRISRADTQILQMAQAVRGLYSSGTPIPAGDQTDNLIAANAVPSDLVLGSGATATLLSPWNGGSTSIWGNAAGTGFTIIMTAVPQSACISVLTNVGGPSADQRLYDASATADAVANAGDVIGTTTSVSGMTPSIAAGAAANNMGGCTGSSYYKIKFGFATKN